MVTLRDGKTVSGELIEPWNPGSVGLYVRRAWARAHVPEWADRWEATEGPTTRRALAPRFDRLDAWRRDRLAAPRVEGRPHHPLDRPRAEARLRDGDAARPPLLIAQPEPQRRPHGGPRPEGRRTPAPSGLDFRIPERGVDARRRPEGGPRRARLRRRSEGPRLDRRALAAEASRPNPAWLDPPGRDRGLVRPRPAVHPPPGARHARVGARPAAEPRTG